MAVAALAMLPRLRFDEPPRYDGAGYAILAQGLSKGAGYREISHPDAPEHAHFPPGYPLALAAVLRVSGDSIRAARVFSLGCTFLAIWAFWQGWLRTEPRGVPTLLGLSLALNWTWDRGGGAIQSEPMFLALMGGTLLAAGPASRRGGLTRGVLVGLGVGLCVLTRHVGACLAIAIGLDLWLRGRRSAALAMLVIASAVVAPWVAWQARLGGGSQAGLFQGRSLAGLVLGQVVFYARRMPDQLFGPFVEVATVFGRSPAAALVATVAAFGFASIVVLGWIRMTLDPRRRLAGLVPLATFPLLLIWPFTEAGRFLIPLVPFLLQGATEGLATIARKLRPGPGYRRIAAASLLALSVPYSAYYLISDREGARLATHADFDAACRWIAARADRPGPVLARHPADVAWLTGRLALDEGSGEIDEEVRRRKAAFVLVDDARYANAPPSPLRSFVDRSPGWVRLAWKGEGSVRVYEVLDSGRPPEKSFPRETR